MAGPRRRSAGAGPLGPEVAFEQVWLPLALRRRHAALVHAPNCFLPLVRPCPGVVTIHDLAFEAWPADFAPATRAKYRVLTPAGRPLGAADHLPVAVHRRRRVPALRGRPGEGAGDPGGAGAGCGVGRPASPAPEAGGDGRYVLAVGDLRAKKNLAALVQRVRGRCAGARGCRTGWCWPGSMRARGPRLRALAGEAPLS